jgi:RNA polymerase sigma-70 factor (ECF subfamily)
MLAVQSLPTNYRLVFNLYAIEGYSHKEIGEMLKMAESTSRANLSLANGLLREKLQKML